jgi:hypothetical protein
MTNLTPEQREIVETNLLEYFAFTQHDIAAELGIKPQPDGSWSDEDAERIFAEVRRQNEAMLISVFDPPASA